MRMEARMFREPRPDRGMLMRGVIVANQMQGFVLGGFPINLAQEGQPFLVAIITASDDRAIERVCSGRQRASWCHDAFFTTASGDIHLSPAEFIIDNWEKRQAA